MAQAGQFFASTLFSHYSLYQHCFSADQDLTEYTDTLLVRGFVCRLMCISHLVHGTVHDNRRPYVCITDGHYQAAGDTAAFPSADFNLLPYVQVETASIPSFSAAITEPEWTAQVEEARSQEEAAARATEEARLAAVDAAEQERMEKERLDALEARKAELTKVRCVVLFRCAK